MGRRNYVITAEEMRRWECAQRKSGISAEVMVESIGAQLWRHLAEVLADVADPHAVVLAGSGNNGADALVLARYAAVAGWRVTIVSFGTKESDLRLLERERLQLVAAESDARIRFITAAEKMTACLPADANAVIEGISGIGCHGELDDVSLRWVQAVNAWHRHGGFVAAVDIPIGTDATTGEIAATPLRADVTWMTVWPKRGLYFYPACAYAGEKMLVSLGLSTDRTWAAELVAPGTSLLRRSIRQGNAHKGSQGHVAVLAGSEGMEGAALLAAQAALYSGAGKVTLWVPEGIRAQVAMVVPEIMVRGIGTGGIWTEEMIPDVDPAIYDALVIGCGIGRSPRTQAWVGEILARWQRPAVVDADALWALTTQKEMAFAQSTVLTPHAGELAQLADLESPVGETARWDVSGTLAAARQAVVVAKGAPTITALPNGERYVNTTGNPGLATAGTGDTLTGIIAALLAHGFSAAEAAVSGVYWHGKAADKLAADGYGFTAGAVSRMMPNVIGKGEDDAAN